MSLDRAADPCLLVGDSREAIDDFARDISLHRGAVFGLHRFSLRQLASKLAEVELARRGLAQATRLGTEAIATRPGPAFEARAAGSLEYLAPIARLRSIGRTLAATLEDLRHDTVDIGSLGGLGDSGTDLVALAHRYEEQLAEAGLVDSAMLLRTAAAAVVGDESGVPLDGPLLLLDVAVRDEATLSFVGALAERAPRVLATVPAGDERTLAALHRLADAREEPSHSAEGAVAALERVRDYLFTPAAPPQLPGPLPDESSAVSFFSAPGEGRECVEVARRIVREAEHGVPFDRMAIFVRAPQLYAGLLETALSRAGVPGWYALGTRGPDPAGRAFLALLACAAEQLSARRFSEYLSLAQVPKMRGRRQDGARCGPCPPAPRTCSRRQRSRLSCRCSTRPAENLPTRPIPMTSR